MHVNHSSQNSQALDPFLGVLAHLHAADHSTDGLARLPIAAIVTSALVDLDDGDPMDDGDAESVAVSLAIDVERDFRALRTLVAEAARRGVDLPSASIATLMTGMERRMRAACALKVAAQRSNAAVPQEEAAAAE